MLNIFEDFVVKRFIQFKDGIIVFNQKEIDRRVRTFFDTVNVKQVSSTDNSYTIEFEPKQDDFDAYDAKVLFESIVSLQNGVFEDVLELPNFESIKVNVDIYNWSVHITTNVSDYKINVIY